jgi:hypothetical protein
VKLHAFLTLALDGHEWSASCPGHFISGEGAHGIYWRKVGVNHSQSGCHEVEKNVCPCQGLNSDSLVIQLIA